METAMTTTFTSSKPASAKQLTYIRALMADRTEAMALHGYAVSDAQLLMLSTVGASRTIDKLRLLPMDAKAKTAGKTFKTVHPGIKPGMYVMDEQIIKVIPSQKADGRLYVAVLKGAPKGMQSSFVSKGKLHLLYDLRPEHKLTKDHASLYGEVYDRCCCCGKLLTVPLSVERGVGPTCWDNYFAG
jgi:hypothetical protein